LLGLHGWVARARARYYRMTLLSRAYGVYASRSKGDLLGSHGQSYYEISYMACEFDSLRHSGMGCIGLLTAAVLPELSKAHGSKKPLLSV
jgi:hypothetical protein